MIVQVWTPARLRTLRRIAKRGYPLATIAEALDVSPAEADRALWVSMGRGLEMAATLLNRVEAA